MFYVISMGVIATGLTFAAIPAYRMFCEATSFGGLTQVLLSIFLSIEVVSTRFRLQTTLKKSQIWIK